MDAATTYGLLQHSEHAEIGRQIEAMDPAEYIEPTNRPEEHPGIVMLGPADHIVKRFYTLAMRYAQAHDAAKAKAHGLEEQNQQALEDCRSREDFEQRTQRPCFQKRVRRMRVLRAEYGRAFLLYNLCMYYVWLECKAQYPDDLPDLYQGPLLFAEWRVGWLPEGDLTPVRYEWQEHSRTHNTQTSPSAPLKAVPVGSVTKH